MDNDTLTGGNNDDTFNVDAGTDTVTDFNNGADSIVISSGAIANITAYGAWTATAGSTNAGTANITTNGYNIDLTLAGGANGWTVTNTGAAATLTGSIKNDTINAGSNGDTVTGGVGGDKLYAGAGADTFVQLDGSSPTVASKDMTSISNGGDYWNWDATADGNDEFLTWTLGSEPDRIYNFDVAADKIQFSSFTTLSTQYVNAGSQWGASWLQLSALTPGVTYAVRGYWVEGNQDFVIRGGADAAGTDILVFQYTGTGSDADMFGNEAVVLVGAGSQYSNLAASNFTSAADTTQPTVTTAISTSGIAVTSNEAGTTTIGATTVTPNATATTFTVGEQTSVATGVLKVTDASSNAGTDTSGRTYTIGTSTGQSLTGQYVWGWGGNDTITGTTSGDNLYGGDNNDNLSGLAGYDIIDGGAGDDKITGGTGFDLLWGGTGRDVFVQLPGDSANWVTSTDTDNYWSDGEYVDWRTSGDWPDVINDFSHTDDKIQINSTVTALKNYDLLDGGVWPVIRKDTLAANTVYVARGNWDNGRFTYKPLSGTDLLVFTSGADKTVVIGQGANIANITLANNFITTVASDTTPPSMSSAAVAADGRSIVITYSEAVAGTLEAGDWTFKVGGATYSGNVSNPVIGGASNNTVTLTLSSAIAQGAVVSDLLYTANAGTANSLTDTANPANAAVTQTVSSVTNSSTVVVDGTAPIVSTSVSTTGLTVTSDEAGTIKVGGVNATVPTSSYTTSPVTLTEQTAVLTGVVTVTDAAGNTGADSNNRSVYLGTSASNTVTGFQFVWGFGGDDTITGTANADSLYGGTGNDTLSYAGSSAGVTVNLTTNTVSGGDAAGDTISEFENIIGSSNADTLTGDANANSLTGGAGTDTLIGGAGDDTYVYNAGEFVQAETITDSSGYDIIWVRTTTALADDAFKNKTGLEEVIFTGTDTASVEANLGLDIQLAGIRTIRLEGGQDDYVSVNFTASVAIYASGSDISNDSTTANVIVYAGAGADTIGGNTSKKTTVSYELSNAAVTIDRGADTASGGFATGDSLNSIVNVIGSSFNDTLISMADGILVDGAAGDDTITGLGGNDTLIGGIGNDTLTGGGGADSVEGGAGNDALYVDNTDTINGGADTDTAYFAGAVSATNLLNADLLNVENIVITNTLGAAYDFSAQSEDLNITGNVAGDTIKGGSGNDTITGGTGIDTFNIDIGNDTVTDLGNGVDILAVAAGASVTVTAVANWTAASTTTYNNGIATINASGYNISLASAGGSAGWTITNSGNATAVTLTGSAYADTIRGGSGADTIDGGAGVDTADYSSATKLAGGALAATDTGITLTLNGSTATTVTVGATNVGADSVRNIENVIGTAGGDTITGDSGNNVITGGAGIDNLDGGTGNDAFNVTTTANDGSDVIVGGSGTDTISVTAGNTIVFTATDANITGVENITLGAGASVTIIGQTEGFTISGSTGNESITSGSGNDTITGGAGSDTLAGGAGIDRLTGGNDGDIFKFIAYSDSTSTAGTDPQANSAATFLNMLDVITDFVRNSDKIDISGFDKGTTIIGSSSIKNAGSSSPEFFTALHAASSGDGSVNTIIRAFTFTYIVADTYIVIDNSASATFDNTTDSVIRITGTPLSSLTLSDFVT